MAPKAGAVLYAKDIDKVRIFYSMVVGLAVTGSEDDHVVLESPSFQLVLVAIPEKIAVDIEISATPIRRENAAIKLVFFVSSISAARALAIDFGGQLSPSEREWTFQGYKVCDGFDPEGNVVQFREV
jgi:predicted enzyme related to lactoylglutathione lyase